MYIVKGLGSNDFVGVLLLYRGDELVMIEHLNTIPYVTFLFCDGESAKTKL